MRLRSCRSAILLALSLCTVDPVFSEGNLIINGGFEEPNIGSGFVHIHDVLGWTATLGPGFEIQHQCAGTPYEGDQLIELDTYANGGMAQSVAVDPSKTYILRFFYSPRPGVSTESNPVEVLLDGDLIEEITGYCDYDTVWEMHENYVDAVSNIMTIEFRGAGISDSYGGYIDQVSLFEDAGTVDANEFPARFHLEAPYPNPFNPVTTLPFSLEETGQVSLQVFDLSGHVVATLVDGLQERGMHEVAFDASTLPSGLYVARMTTEAGAAVQKIVLAK